MGLLASLERFGLKLQVLWDAFIDQLPPEKKSLAKLATLRHLRDRSGLEGLFESKSQPLAEVLIENAFNMYLQQIKVLLFNDSTNLPHGAECVGQKENSGLSMVTEQA